MAASRATLAAVAVMAVLVAVMAPIAVAQPSIDSLAGVYDSRANPAQAVSFHILATPTATRAYAVRGDGWEAVGYGYGRDFTGAIRRVGKDGKPLDQPPGSLTFTIERDGIHARARYADGANFDDTWTRAGSWGRSDNPAAKHPGDGAPAGIPADPDRPKFGDYVQVDELPEAITKVPPKYPDRARNAKVDGTVVVQALVGRDGTVRDTKVVKSVHADLAEAARACVAQWKFKPARAAGKPVAVWVAIPIKFTLH